MDTPIRMHGAAPRSRPRPAEDHEAAYGFEITYLRLCRGQGFQLTSTLKPRPGDWVLGENVPDDLELITEPARALRDREVVVPSLGRLVQMLREQAHAVVIDCYPDDFACMAFDENSFSLANVVSRNPEEAALRALLFILSERAANEPR
jgi:hypothetical protein